MLLAFHVENDLRVVAETPPVREPRRARGREVVGETYIAQRRYGVGKTDQQNGLMAAAQPYLPKGAGASALRIFARRAGQWSDLEWELGNFAVHDHEGKPFRDQRVQPAAREPAPRCLSMGAARRCPGRGMIGASCPCRGACKKGRLMTIQILNRHRKRAHTPWASPTVAATQDGAAWKWTDVGCTRRLTRTQLVHSPATGVISAAFRPNVKHFEPTASVSRLVINEEQGAVPGGNISPTTAIAAGDSAVTLG